jgi:putative membrane protein
MARGRNNDSRLLAIAIRLGINAGALWVASQYVRGFEVHGWQSLIATAAIFGAVNAFIKPAAQLLGTPISCMTLGLFVLVINVAMLALTAWIASAFHLDVAIDGFWALFFAALLIGVTSWALSTFVGKPLKVALG